MAGTEVGSLYYDLNIDDKNLKRQLDDADKSVKGFGDHVSQYWGSSVDASRKFGLALAAVGAGVVAFGVSSVKAYSESQNAIAQTNAVLTSTGHAAGVTADQVTKLATALERQTKFSDEDVRATENLLLTFTSIGKDIFPQATKTVLDMATALGEDTKSASIQLGKALQDPILGVTALRRVGVNFNQAQQDVIKNLVDTGRAAEAQKLILAELNKEFGGSAVAAGQTLAGRLAMLKNQFNNVQEAIGGILATVATPLLDALLRWFDRVGGVEGVLKLLREELDRIKPYLPEITGAIIGGLVPALVAAAIAGGEFLLTLAPWLALGALAGWAAHHFGFGLDDLRNAMSKVKPFIKDIADGAKDIWDWFTNLNPVVQTLISPLAALINAFANGSLTIKGLIQDVKDIWNWFSNLTVVIVIAQFITQVLWPALEAIAASIWQNLRPALMQLWDSLTRLWNALNPALMDALKIVGAILLGLFLVAIWAALSVLNILIQVFAGVVSAISNVINWIANIIGWFGNLIGIVWNAIKTIADIMWHLPAAFKDVVGALFSIAGSIIGGIWNAVKGIAGTIGNAIGGAVSAVWGFYGQFVDAGWGLIRAFANGIKNAAGEAVNAAKGVLSKVRNLLPFSDAKTGPLSDLTLSGRRFSETFAKGIIGASDHVTDAVQNSLALPFGALTADLSANVIAPALQPQNMGGGGSGGAPAVSPTVNQFSGDIHLGDAGAVNTFFDKLDRNTYLETIGVSPQ